MALTARRAPLSPELRLLLYLGGMTRTVDRDEQARRLLERPVAWDSFLHSARVHGLVPMAYRNLRSLGFPAVPAPMEAELRTQYLANAMRNELLWRELGAVVSTLSGAGIPTICWKGVALSKWLYGDTSLRVCSDLDIVVPRDRARDASVVLGDRGYMTLDGAALTEPLPPYKECALVRRTEAMSFGIGLHWDFVTDSRRATEEVWARAETTSVVGVPTLMPSAEWQLLSVAAHGAGHAWASLKWLVDLHDICSKATIDWDAVERWAQALGWKRAVGMSLGASRELFGTELPVPAIAMQPPKWVPLAPDDPFRTWHAVATSLTMRPGPAAKARYLTQLAFNVSSDDATSVVRHSLSTLRPIRMLRRSGGASRSWVVTLLRRRFAPLVPSAASETEPSGRGVPRALAGRRDEERVE